MSRRWDTLGVAVTAFLAMCGVWLPSTGCGINGSSTDADAGEAPPISFSVSQAPFERNKGLDDAIAADHLRPGEVVASIRRVELHDLGQHALFVTILDGDVARTFAVVNGARVDRVAELVKKERSQRAASTGPMTTTLLQVRSQAHDTDLIEVVILVGGDFEEPTLPFDGTDTPASQADYRDWISAHRARQRIAIADIKQPLYSRIEELGGVLLDDLAATPLITARLTATAIDQLAFDAELPVVAIDVRPDAAAPLLGYAGHAAMQLPLLAGGQCGTAGCTGGFTAVGIWEADADHLDTPGAVANKNGRFAPYSAHYQYYPHLCDSLDDCNDNVPGNSQSCELARVAPNGSDPPFPPTQKFCVVEHTSYVAASLGMIGDYTYAAGQLGTSPVTFTSRAGTWDVELYIANDSSGAGGEYLLEQPVIYANRSVASGGYSIGWLIDWAARHDLLFLTQAGGNSGTDEVQCRYDYNALCVGYYNYTDSYTSLTAHTRDPDSSYINHPLLGLERPHVLGPGGHLDGDGLHSVDIEDTSTLMRSAGIGGNPISGSSFAAPSVLSLAIQAHQYEGWFSNLTFPVTKKSVILAGSVDANQDGPIENTTSWSTAYDGYDGAGQPSRTFIKQILDSNQYKYKALSDSDFVSCGTGCREYTVASVTTTAKAIKVALTWNSCNTFIGETSQLANDLDLVVVRPPFLPCSGTRQSITDNDNVEMVYDSCLKTLGQTGTYTIKVRIKDGLPLSGCGTSETEPVGIAWSLQ